MRRYALIVAASLLPAAAHPAIVSYEVLLDLDVNVATGCTIATPKGAVGGIEQVLVTTVTTTTSGGSVTNVSRRVCGGGTLGAPVTVDTGGWAVGLGNGSLGTAAIETYVPRALLGSSTRAGVAVASSGGGGGDAILGAPGSPLPVVSIVPSATAAPVDIPLLTPWGLVLLAALLGAFGWRAARRNNVAVLIAAAALTTAAAGIVWAATVILDGQIGDWGGVPATATDAKGNAPQNADLVALYAQNDATRVFFRIDADVVPEAPANAAPVVNAGADQPITLPAAAAVSATVSDDGLPIPPGALTLGWSKVSGPGTVTFGAPGAAATTASFSASGVYILRFTASDGALSTSDDVQVTVSPAVGVNQAPAVNAGADQTITLPASASLSGSASDDGLPSPPGAMSLAWTKVSGPGAVTFASPGSVATTASFDVAGTYVLRLTAADGSLVASDDVQVTVNGGEPPTLNPPPVNQSVATTIGGSTAFLYTGPNAVQTGVVPGTIEERRAAVVRGKVLTRAGDPLSGVVVTILGRPEFGQTQTRADGVFDMAVNGGGPLTVNYAAAGLLPVQRQVNVPWQDFAIAPDVVMTPLDTQVSTIAANAPAIQVHQGSPVADADGSRKAVLLFPAGTSAQLVLPNGSMQALATLSVRATEYTVGPQGPSAMPAALPANTAYTYAVELSVDEAIAAGATRVEFSQPVVNYVENFLGLPVGTAVPSGYYDRSKAAWVASDNGRIVRVTGITGGLADVDTVGSGSLPALALTDAERQQLASLYAVGTTLWRVPVSHFTPWDYNYPFGPPADADDPADLGARVARTDQSIDGSCEAPGSVIECENRVLGETVDLPGTPYSLHYRSNRVSGYGAAVDLQLSGPKLPASLIRIEIRATIAGRVVERTFAPLPNQSTRIDWDGTDVYGRPAQGGQWISGTIDYIYPLSYLAPADFAKNFGNFGGSTVFGPGRQRSEFRASLPFRLPMREGIADARGLGLGGWTLDAQHFYDPSTSVLDLGNGVRRRSDPVSQVFNAVHRKSNAHQLTGLAVGPEGSVYFAVTDFSSNPAGYTIRRLAPGGTETVFAGGGDLNHLGAAGDGGPATLAQFSGQPSSPTVGPDGSLYFVEGHVVRRVRPDGVIERVAGTYVIDVFNNCLDENTITPDGALAAESRLCIRQMLVTPDGSVLLLEKLGSGPDHRIRRVGPDGRLVTVFGGGGWCDPFYDPALVCGDGGPAASARSYALSQMALAPDGALYVADRGKIRKVSANGVVTSVAGDHLALGSAGDGQLAGSSTRFCSTPTGLAVTPDGTLLISDYNRVRRIAPGGRVATIAGSTPACSDPGAPSGFGGPALQAVIGRPTTLALSPDGDLYKLGSDPTGPRINRIGRPLPGFNASDIAVASKDGRLLYRFDANGRHLQTVDALTGGVLREFVYDASGRLSQAIEKTGGTDNVTTIERDASGNPTAIVGPYGQRTTLSVDANGFLAALTNPAGETTAFTQTTSGLLTSKTAPGNRTSAFTYDASGRLTRDTDPGGGTQDLALTGSADAFTVTRQTALGRTASYGVERLPDRVLRRTITSMDGTVAIATDILDAGTRSLSAPDGATATIVASADPRFGMASPVAKSVSYKLPSLLTLTESSTRTAVLANPVNPLSLTTLTETTSINGHTTTSTYTGATRTRVSITPAGRTFTETFDALGRRTSTQLGTLLPMTFGYDSRGRIAALAQGGRSYALSYDAAGYLQSMTDPLGRTFQYGRDAAGRVTAKTFPDGAVFGVTYNVAGEIATVTPPARTAHAFAYDGRGDLVTITPPLVAGSGPSGFVYDADRALTQASGPGGESIAFGYDAAGRLTGASLTNVGLPPSIYGVAYDAAGRVASVAGPNAQSASFTYDGRLVTSINWTGPVAGSVALTYDPDFRIATESVNGGPAVTFGYSADGLLVQAGGLSVSRSAQTGLVQSTVLGIVSDSFTRNSLGEATAYTAVANATPLYTANVIRDASGRITQRQETIEGVASTFDYAYDLRGRLVSVTRNAVVVESYAYDANGNRTNATVAGVARTATHDAQDRLIADGPRSFAYSPAGRLVSRTNGTATTAYRYDAVGNLIGVTLPTGTVIDYQVDGMARRIGKSVGGVPVQKFLHHGLLPVAELDGAGTLRSRFVFGPGLVPTHMIKGGDTFRIITDPIGSVRLVVNAATGAVMQRIDYDSFGNVTLDTNPGFQPFGFASGIYDPDTRLVRFGARDYDAESGRWTAKDPTGFRGRDGNLYAYAFNDPVNRADPRGKLAPVVVAGLVALWGAAEVGLTVSDVVDFVEGLADPNVSALESVVGGGLLAAGVLLPGGGYGKLDDVCKQLDELVEKGQLTSYIDDLGEKVYAHSDKEFAKSLGEKVKGTVDQLDEYIRRTIREVGGGDGLKLVKPEQATGGGFNPFKRRL